LRTANAEALGDFRRSNPFHCFAHRKAGPQSCLLGGSPGKKLTDALITDFGTAMLGAELAYLAQPSPERLGVDFPVAVGARDALDTVEKPVRRRRNSSAPLRVVDPPSRRVFAIIAALINESYRLHKHGRRFSDLALKIRYAVFALAQSLDKQEFQLRHVFLSYSRSAIKRLQRCGNIMGRQPKMVRSLCIGGAEVIGSDNSTQGLDARR
jgi:hypothetical protein